MLRYIPQAQYHRCTREQYDHVLIFYGYLFSQSHDVHRGVFDTIYTVGAHIGGRLFHKIFAYIRRTY